MPPGLQEVAQFHQEPIFVFYRGLVKSDIFVYRNASALPRAWWAVRVTGAASEAEMVAAVKANNLHTTAVVLGPASAEIRAAPEDSVQIVAQRDGCLAADLLTRNKRFLVLSEVWHPGWHGAPRWPTGAAAAGKCCADGPLGSTGKTPVGSRVPASLLAARLHYQHPRRRFPGGARFLMCLSCAGVREHSTRANLIPDAEEYRLEERKRLDGSKGKEEAAGQPHPSSKDPSPGRWSRCRRRPLRFGRAALRGGDESPSLFSRCAVPAVCALLLLAVALVLPRPCKPHARP